MEAEIETGFWWIRVHRNCRSVWTVARHVGGPEWVDTFGESYWITDPELIGPPVKGARRADSTCEHQGHTEKA